MDETSDKQSFGKGFVILTAAGLLIKVLSVFYNPLLRRILGEEGVGIYSSVYYVFNFVYVIGNTGLPSAISKNISELLALQRYKDAVNAFKITRLFLFALGLFLSLSLFAFAGPISKMFGNSSIKIGLQVLSPTLFITCLLSCYRGYFQGRGNVKPTAVSQIFEQVFNVVFSLLIAYLLLKYGDIELGVAGATTGTTIGAIVALLILISYYNKDKTIRVSKINAKEKVQKRKALLLKKVIKYSIPMTICVLIQNMGMLFDNIIASRILPTMGMNADALVGNVFNYNSLVGVPIAIITSLSVVVLPAISRFAALDDMKNLRKNTFYAYKLTFLVSVPCAVGLMSLSGPICKILGYNSVIVNLLVLGVLNIVLMSVAQIQVSILQGFGKINVVTFHSFFGLVCKIVADIVFIRMPFFNIYGILIGNFVYYLVPILMNSLSIRRTLRCKIKMAKRIFLIVVSSVLMGAAAILCHRVVSFVFGLISKHVYINNVIATVISIVVGAIVYVFVLTVTKSIRKKDFDVFPKKLLKVIPSFIKNRLT
ncbi:stage V sporulation protein B [Hathewaya proteolytica DSM 3090]|uniref:Stage V sporulation protein B n=1 Tax=Hathewaya proteolytica DSM 3090 TaxID=1121331 RepID=A0A1M6LG43_9CLOT|nr:polysaccharide biosynthesis protein [Hathewaya proteolytica]SHJ70160.1 stage V sporulation protein B [Hathewaya proteolytica DSM 3090]